MKAVVARYDAVELITQRAQVSAEIKAKLMERAANFYLVRTALIVRRSKK